MSKLKEFYVWKVSADLFGPKNEPLGEIVRHVTTPYATIEASFGIVAEVFHRSLLDCHATITGITLACYTYLGGTTIGQDSPR